MIKKKFTDENRHLYFKKCKFQGSAYVCGTNTLPYVTKYRNTTTISTSTLPLWPVSFSESQRSSNTSVSSLCLRPKIYYNGIVYLLTTTKEAGKNATLALLSSTVFRMNGLQIEIRNTCTDIVSINR